MGGVSIGNGAIIAANILVSKDVPDYSIVGGVPARVHSYRFDSDTIDQRLLSHWRDWPIDFIKANRDLFVDKVKKGAGDILKGSYRANEEE